MREQVRAWIAGGIVKDDEPLQKARRDIETVKLIIKLVIY